MVRLWRFLHTPQGTKLFRYTMGSVITTGVSFSVLTLMFGVLRLWSAVPDTLVANLSATVPSYFLNRNWAWGKSGRSRVLREMVPFWVTSVVGIIVSLGAAQLARTFSDTHHLHHLLATVVVDGANLATFGVLWVGKFLIFNRLFRSSGTPVLGDELAEVA